jgi:hypothetical protein
MMWNRPISPNELEMNSKDFCSWLNVTNERVKVCPLVTKSQKLSILLLKWQTDDKNSPPPRLRPNLYIAMMLIVNDKVGD